jgi:mono/diheme cytochrome c family protein
MTRTSLSFAAALVVAAGGFGADDAGAVLQKYCGRCHGPGGTNEGGVNYILDAKEMAAKKKVVPGDADKSKIFKLVTSGEMPPEGEEPRPTKEDMEVLKKWIAAGAKPFAAPAASKRQPQSMTQQLEAMVQHLRSTPIEDRPYQRFFTVANFVNNPTYTDAEVRLYRAALSKAVNSLSYKPRIVPPQMLGEAGAVLAIDLRDYDWDRCHLWPAILKHYPYGLKYDRAADRRVAELAHELYTLSGTDLPFLRADWFVAYATRPPIYHEVLFELLMGLPGESLTAGAPRPHHVMNARDLEAKLHVNAIDNIRRGTALRAGFTGSGVSGQNRIVERHDATYGAYWKSYDFKSNADVGNMFRFPLGPRFHGHPYEGMAFEHDGGEAIFHLPNGMQGYLLMNGADDRIDEGPIEVVSDSKKTSGTAKIVNGVSCIACHKAGMITPPKDAVAAGSSAQGDARVLVHRLYPSTEKLQKFVDEDAEKFNAALAKAIAPFLKEEDKALLELEEPVGKLSRNYLLKELTVEEAAYELGLDDPKLLQGAVRVSEPLRNLGLGPFAAGGTIKREAWDALTNFNSAFQEAASALDVAVPKRVFQRR